MVSLLKNKQQLSSSKTSCVLPVRDAELTILIKFAFWRGSYPEEVKASNLRGAKSRDSYRRIAGESYRCGSNHHCSLAVISPPKTQKLVLTDPAFVVLRFESCDWRSLVQNLFHVASGVTIRVTIGAIVESLGVTIPIRVPIGVPTGVFIQESVQESM